MKLFSLMVIVTLSASSFFAPAHAVDLIRVQGKAEKKFPPDVAYLSATVWSKAKSAKKAEEINAEEFARIESLLTQTFKIEKKAIQTTGLSINPEYQYNPNTNPVVIAYHNQHQIRVTVNDVQNLGKIIDSLLSNKSVSEKNGVNIDGVQFATENTSAYELETLAEAMKNARARAEVIAKSTGRIIKNVRLVIHNSPSVAVPLRSEMVAMPADARAMKGASPGTSVQAGEISVTAEVTAEYEF